MRARGNGSGDAGPEANDIEEAVSCAGTALFHELARVVAALAEHEGLRSLTLPYPPAAQRALDRTVLHCLDLGEAPPRSLPELLEWCRWRPAGDPLFEVPASFLTPDVTLVHPVGVMPTRACLELASHGSEGGVEKEAHGLLIELEARCGSFEQYRRCRQFLARHPVVHRQDRFRGGWNKAVWTRVRHLYRPLPESLLAGGTFLACSTCGLPALLRDRKVPAHGPPVSGPDTWCEGEECPHGHSLELIRDPDQAWLLRRPLRAFLALPHQVEKDALDELDRAEIAYESLPGDLSAYRLRGMGPGTRGIQVYDRLQPALLAARCIDPAMPLPDPTLVVVPQRLAERAQYRAAFTAALPDVLQERVLLTTPQDLVRHAHAQPVSGAHGTGAAGVRIQDQKEKAKDA